jgi:hypothetical protein
MDTSEAKQAEGSFGAISPSSPLALDYQSDADGRHYDTVFLPVFEVHGIDER